MYHPEHVCQTRQVYAVELPTYTPIISDTPSRIRKKKPTPPTTVVSFCYYHSCIAATPNDVSDGDTQTYNKNREYTRER
eukprot:scaffold517613_cov17-Prasinocladus_malaysianus.AAC.1